MFCPLLLCLDARLVQTIISANGTGPCTSLAPGIVPSAQPCFHINNQQTNEVSAKIREVHKGKKKNIRKISPSNVSLLNSIVLWVTLQCSTWLRKAGVVWLHTLGEALLGLHWENYCNTLVCTKLHNKEKLTVWLLHPRQDQKNF